MTPQKTGIAAGLLLTGLLTVLSQTEALPRLGQWLRGLSLSGPAGNAAAWTAVLLCAALPALGLLTRGRCGWDWLLFLASLQILAGLYFLVNPSLLTTLPDAGQLWGFTAACGTAATLLAWVVLRGLSRLEKAVSVGKSLAVLLNGTSCLLLCFTGWNHAVWLHEKISQAAAGNTAEIAGQMYPTYFSLTLLALADMVPTLLGCLVLLWGGWLARAMESDPFGADTVTLADQLSRRCAGTAAASVLICVGGNVFQMLFFSSLRSVAVTIDFPAATVLLSAALGLLCRYIRQAKAVSDDNESII